MSFSKTGTGFCDLSVRYWALPTAGVLSAAKLDMLYTLTTNWLAVHKSNGCAVIIHPNRGGQFEGLGVKTPA